MLILLSALLSTLCSMFRSRAALELEHIALRHQIGVLKRSAGKRPKLTAADRLFWVFLSRVWCDWRSALDIVRPATAIAWHRKGFRLFWTWKIRHGRVGRPAVSREVRDLIRRMSRENALWGAPHIHGELLKLGIEISETSVAKYVVRHRKPPSQTWRTFLDNHVQNLVSVDFFTVPTIRFQVLYVFLVLAHDRRRVVAKRIPVIFTAVSINGDHGYVFIQDKDGPCIGCLFPDMVGDDRYPCPGTPAIADILQAVGSLAVYAVDTLLVNRARSWNYRRISLADGTLDCATRIPPRQDCRMLAHTQ